MVSQLYKIGMAQYEKNLQNFVEFPKAPEWLTKYKIKQEVDLDQSIQKLESEIHELEIQHKNFDKIDALLYGTGESLESAVEVVLKDMGCSVEKLEKGATVDLKAHLNEMSFVLEVTGVDEKIYKDNKHFAQILQYLPYREEKERIVLLANTYRNKDVSERMGKEHFTKPVLELSRDNHFCIMTTCDLYFVWRDYKSGVAPEKLLAQIFRAEGEFKYTAI